MPGILSTNNPVVKVSGLWPSTVTTGLLVLMCLNGGNTIFFIIPQFEAKGLLSTRIL